MITVLTGDFGSGKTSELARLVGADVEASRPTFLLVPEQQTVSAERDMADLLPPSAPLCFEVANFSRLANTVFRRVGGLSYRYADAGTRTLIMWRAMSALQPFLHEKNRNGIPELGRVRKMTVAMRELAMFELTPAQMSRAASSLEEGSHLREKLEDLSLLAELYRDLLHERYDDATDDLTRLADLLKKTDALAGTRIYLDGFVSYTEQQYRVLRMLARSSDIVLTLTLPADREEELCFAETKETFARLKNLAERADVPFVRRDLGENKRTRSTLLKKLMLRLFDGAEEPPVCCETDEKEDFSTVAAADAFAAAEYIAADIARRVAAGAHYRDFAVVARQAEQYVGILDVALRRADIPCFLAKKTDVATYSAVKLIYSAYAVVTGGWKQSDTVAYLKCGLSGISPDDIDIYELYTSRWRLTGRRITDDVAWNMNPDGYTERMTERGRDIVETAEAVRRKMLDQLIPLAEGCGVRPLKDHARSLFEFLTFLDVEKQLAERAEAARVSRNAAEADELSRLFGVLCDALDALCDALPDVEINAEGFVDLLKLMFGEVDMAHIPTSLDEVTVGSADLLRVGHVKHIYLLGVNEGEFPASVGDSGVFSENDRRDLAALGLPVTPDLLLRSARELFCFARAFATAEESVTLLYAEKSLSGSSLTPSGELLHLVKLTKDAVPVRHTASLSPEERFFRTGTALDYLGLLSETPAGRALARFFAASAEHGELLARTRAPLVEPACRLTRTTADALWGKKLSLTQSRIDSYVRCPFSYFCRYVLKLDPGRTIDFDYADVGNLLHTVLEKFFDGLARDGLDIRDFTAEKMCERVDKIIEDYLAVICPDEMQRTPRLLHLVTRLRRVARLVVGELCEEMRQSDFTPVLFEAALEGDSAEDPGALPFCLPDGTRVSLYGRIDRVDAYEKDGKTYLRVIDYKSGDKKFSLEDVSRGLNLQLLVYLFSLWKSENPKFREKMARGGDLLPAGVLYVGAGLKDELLDAPTPPEEVLASVRKAVYHRGLLLDDPAVLRAMDRDMNGRFIPVALNKDGSYAKRSLPWLASLEKMGELVGEIDGIVCRIAGEMRAGDATARPLAHKNAYVCEYCEMKSVCRSARLE